MAINTATTPIMGTGLVTTDIGSSDRAYSVTLQSDGKILVAGDSGFDFALARYNADGSLDTSFSGDGVVTTNFGALGGGGYSVTVQADGKILVAGDSGSNFALVRYNSDGSLDTSFSGDGLVTTDFGASDGGYSVTVQADGKILVAGDSGGKFALARYNANGSLDTSFSGDGLVTTNFGSSSVGYSVTVQANGKILVAGDSGGKFALARYNANGSLDTSFSGGGLVTTDLGDYAVGYSVTVQADGKILVAGNSGSKFALARYNDDGSLDTSFSGDGLITTALSYLGGDGGRSVTVQADGKILVAGTLEGDFALLRYNANGSLDTSFSGDGLVITNFGYDDKGYSVTVQADGKILVAGDSESNFALARYNTDGSLDTSFDSRNANDVLYGDANANVLIGLGGNDALYGKSGNDILWGGDGDDILNGGTGIDAASYADSTAGVRVDLNLRTAQDTQGAGIDTLAGIERLNGSGYADKLTGNTANNMLVGGNGNDTLKGNDGTDKLNGGAGNDALFGGEGKDTLTGGTGKDAFVFDTSLTSWDLITDFNHSQGDLIKLSKATFSAFGYTGALHADDFYAAAGATAAHDATDRLIYNTASGVLYYDADGAGGTAAVQIAQLGSTTHPVLVSGDFLIIA